MSLDFWLGLALSIPVGIAVNLLTPKFSAWFSTRNARFAEARRQKQLTREKFGIDLRDNPFAYSAFLQRMNGRLWTYLVLIVIAINLPFYAQIISESVLGGGYGSVFYLLTILLITFLAVGFLNTRRRSNDTSALVARLYSVDDKNPSELQDGKESSERE